MSDLQNKLGTVEDMLNGLKQYLYLKDRHKTKSETLDRIINAVSGIAEDVEELEVYRDDLLTQVSALEGDILDLEAELDQARSELDRWEEMDIPANTTPGAFTDNVAELLCRSLYKLEPRNKMDPLVCNLRDVLSKWGLYPIPGGML